MIARTDGAGIGVAVVGHAAVIAALILLYDRIDPIPEPAPMEVEFIEEIGPVSSAPEIAAEAAPSVGEEVAPAEEAAGAEASVPEPVRPPLPEPVRAPVETGERRRPDLTRNPVQTRPAPPPRVAQTPPPRPQTQPRQQTRPPQRPAPRSQPAPPGRAEGQRSAGLDIRRLQEVIGRGQPTSRSQSQGAPAQLTGAQRQQIARNISGLIAPCAGRAQAPNALARTISVDLRVTVNRDGTPTGHTMVGSSGVTPTNDDYVDDVVAVAMRAVRACASRIATLPDEHYDVSGGWRTFRYRFRFP